jgi:hypothetical protein
MWPVSFLSLHFWQHVTSITHKLLLALPRSAVESLQQQNRKAASVPPLRSPPSQVPAAPVCALTRASLAVLLCQPRPRVGLQLCAAGECSHFMVHINWPFKSRALTVLLRNSLLCVCILSLSLSQWLPKLLGGCQREFRLKRSD